MKTIKQYEASDVDLNDDRDGAIAAAITLCLMEMMSGAKKIGPFASKDESDIILKGAVALFRSITEQQGYALTKREEVPAVFRDLDRAN